MVKKAIILGASRYYSRSIEAAKKAGYYIISLDRNPDSEGFNVANEYFVCDIVDKQKVLAIARNNNISGIIPLNDYGVPTAAYVSEKLNLPGISEKTASLATNKELMRKQWIKDGVPCPRVMVGKSYQEVSDAIGQIGFPCILKPAHGIGGASRGVIVVRDKNEVDEAIYFSQKFYEDKSTLIESFVEAEYEHSAEVLIYNGEVHVIAISDKIKSPLPYRVDKNVIYPTKLDGDRLEQLKNVIKQSVLSIGINYGAAHVELASTSSGFILFELGARCGGGGTPEPIVPFVTGIEEFVELVRILCGDKPCRLEPIFNKGCNYHFITLSPGKIKKIDNFDSIRKNKNVLDAELFIKEGQIVSDITVGTERSGFIIVGADTRDVALKIGYNLEESIKIEYYT
jgi:biotin carboxylase